MLPTDEQQRIIDHDPSTNGRVLAGPGTGKSWTSIAMITRLIENQQEIRIRLLTFTRAATQELAKKIKDADLELVAPSTIHSFALSVLLRNQEFSRLPTPLRIPDSWELQELIRTNIARRLRSMGHEGITVNQVKDLENELSASWQSLDNNIRLFSEIDPQVRNAFVGLWEIHRRVYGYTLLAELPFRAGNMIEDFDIIIEPTNLLIVDEYQDLNEADIKLIKLVSDRGGAKVVAIGDDDQSIYGFRMAAPEGIRRFPNEFGDCIDYALTLSQRCGQYILDPATTMIETVINRPRKQPLRYKVDADPGTFLYLRLNNEQEEARGVADLILARNLSGVPLGEIVVLVRSQVETWANLLKPELEARGIDAIETDWIKSIFTNRDIRRKLAIMRLVIDQTDSLAWWTLLRLEQGISQQFRDYIFDEATESNKQFGDALIHLNPEYPRAPTRNSSMAASRLLNRTLDEIQRINLNEVQLGDTGWGGFVIDFIGRDQMSEDVITVFENIGESIPIEFGLDYFLSQLEPIARDLATQSDAVRIMSMTSSKGITVDTCIVMGVEDGIIPHPRAREDEERRLLYVAMTRATKFCVLTFAHRRRGPTARQGTSNVNRLRGRSPLLASLPIGRFQDGRRIIDQLLTNANRNRK